MYCTLDDLKKRISENDLIQLTDDDNLGEIDEACVADLIASTGELIDGFLRGRYTLPLSPVPGIIKAISADLVIFELYGRRPTFGIPEAVDKKQAAQMKVLKQIQDGVITLGSVGTVSAAATASTNQILVASATPTITDTKLRNY